jgi:hypothetical protein
MITVMIMLIIINDNANNDPPLQYHVDQQQLQQAQSQARAAAAARARTHTCNARKRTHSRMHARTDDPRTPTQVACACMYGVSHVRTMGLRAPVCWQSSAASVISEEAWHAVDSLALAQAVLR